MKPTPAFLAAAPVNPQPLATGLNYPATATEPGLTLAPFFLDIENGLPAAGRLTRRLFVVSPIDSTLDPAGTTPPAVTLAGNLNQVFTLEVTITDDTDPAAVEWEYVLNGADPVAGPAFDSGDDFTYAIASLGVSIEFPTDTYTDDNVYTAVNTPGTVSLVGMVSENDASRVIATRSTTGAVDITIDPEDAAYTVEVDAAYDGNLSGVIATRRNGRLRVAGSVSNAASIPTITPDALASTVRSRSAGKPVYSVVQDECVNALSFTTDGSGNVVNPGSAYNGTLSAYITRPGVGTYRVTLQKRLPPGTVLLACATGATAAASAVLGSADNIIDISTTLADVASNIVSGTVVLFIFAPLTGVGNTNQSTFNDTVAPKNTFAAAMDYPVQSSAEGVVLLPFSFEVNGAGLVLETDNTVIPDGVVLRRASTSYVFEIGKARMAVGFAVADGAPALLPFTNTNLQSQGRMSLTATLASTVVRGFILAVGAP